MSSFSLLSVSSLCLLVLFHGCFGQLEQVTLTSWGGSQQQQHHLRGFQSECRIENLDALEPSRRIKAEAGVTELWDQNDKQFQCAGVAAVRHTIEPKGLLLPSFTNAHHLTYIVQGKGIMGVIIPGCAETYEESHSQQSSGSGDRSQRQSDQHQKIQNFREGDILAFPAGVAHWAYNDGQNPIIAVTVFDTSNDANQLDQNLRKFFLAGNPQQDQQQQEGGQKKQQQESSSGGNILSGFDQQLLAEAFDVETELIKNIQGQDDQRGNIVRVRDELKVISPQRRQEQEQQERQQQEQPGKGDKDNGLEETICSLRHKQNIADPIEADVYNPRGGRITTLNSQKLPILNYLQLSAERGALYRNGILAPQWNMNAHSVIYITRGNTRMQIVGDNGQTVYDGQVQQGQLIIVPQNFVVGEELFILEGIFSYPKSVEDLEAAYEDITLRAISLLQHDVDELVLTVEEFRRENMILKTRLAIADKFAALYEEAGENTSYLLIFFGILRSFSTWVGSSLHFFTSRF